MKTFVNIPVETLTAECVKTSYVLLLVRMCSGGGAGRCQYCVDTSVQSGVSPAPDNTHAASSYSHVIQLFCHPEGHYQNHSISAWMTR